MIIIENANTDLKLRRNNPMELTEMRSMQPMLEKYPHE